MNKNKIFEAAKTGVISITSEALTHLIDETIAYVKETHSSANGSNWIPPVEAKKMLCISSNSNLLRLRNEGLIRYTQPQHKVILYDRNSISNYLEKHAKNTF
jgi:hypothetical protein